MARIHRRNARAAIDFAADVAFTLYLYRNNLFGQTKETDSIEWTYHAFPISIRNDAQMYQWMHWHQSNWCKIEPQTGSPQKRNFRIQMRGEWNGSHNDFDYKITKFSMIFRCCRVVIVVRHIDSLWSKQPAALTSFRLAVFLLLFIFFCCCECLNDATQTHNVRSLVRRVYPSICHHKWFTYMTNVCFMHGINYYCCDWLEWSKCYSKSKSQSNFMCNGCCVRTTLHLWCAICSVSSQKIPFIVRNRQIADSKYWHISIMRSSTKN